MQNYKKYAEIALFIVSLLANNVECYRLQQLKKNCTI